MKITIGRNELVSELNNLYKLFSKENKYYLCDKISKFKSSLNTNQKNIVYSSDIKVYFSDEKNKEVIIEMNSNLISSFVTSIGMPLSNLAESIMTSDQKNKFMKKSKQITNKGLFHIAVRHRLFSFIKK